jgi:hypothetical protein
VVIGSGLPALRTAHGIVSAHLVGKPDTGLAVNLCFLDEKRESLVVGMTDPTPDAVDRCRRFLHERACPAPVVFLRCPPAVRHANKQSHNRPLVGGLQVRTQANEAGTICIAATRAGASGFVTAGHVVESVGTKVYQPQVSGQNDWLAGTTAVVSGYAGTADSDSAFLTNDAPMDDKKIWRTNTTTYTVTGTSPVPALGTTVFMQGASTKTAERSGEIAGTDVTVNFVDGGVLRHQCVATYGSADGDSGAPVYLKDPVLLVGLNVGATEARYIDPAPDEHTYPPVRDEYAIISPWANIERDLGVVLR